MSLCGWRILSVSFAIDHLNLPGNHRRQPIGLLGPLTSNHTYMASRAHGRAFQGRRGSGPSQSQYASQRNRAAASEEEEDEQDYEDDDDDNEREPQRSGEASQAATKKKKKATSGTQKSALNPEVRLNHRPP